MALQESFSELKISPQAWCINSTQRINDMNYNQLISDPSTYVKKRAQRSDDSILLRHMDDVVGTGPYEHLMSDFEHMKTSLYLKDVVVLHHEGDTVNFSGLEITKTRKGFEVKNSTDLVQSLLNLYGLQNSTPTVNPDRRSTVMELASAKRRGPGGLEHIEIRCLSTQQWRRENRIFVSRVDTKNNTVDPFTKHLDGLRTRALAKNLGLRFLDMADGGTNENDR